MADSLREDATAIGLAGVRAADPGRCTRAALASSPIAARLATVASVRVVAVGKASVAMWEAAAPLLPPAREALVIAPAAPSVPLAPPARACLAGHPLPTPGSQDAARDALAIARRVGDDECLVLLVSGGASALMAGPAGGLSLDDKVATTRALLHSGADIVEINAVRKHLSVVKGGRLARAAGGRCLTLALSDVIGAHEDDLSVIGSGPGVADASTFAEALRIVEARGLRDTLPAGVVRRLEAGARGEVDETPKPGDADLRHVVASVIGGRRDAMRGAAEEAARRGFRVEVVEAPLLGEAREAAPAFVASALEKGVGTIFRGDRKGVGTIFRDGEGKIVPTPFPGPTPFRGRLCVVASGETTVTVRGTGRGGRNQEFALAAAPLLAAHGRPVALLSLGTDGVDGPTDAAGGLVDHATVARAAALRVSIDAALADNDAYACLQRLGDLVVTGPTGTNVGDLVVITMA